MYTGVLFHGLCHVPKYECFTSDEKLVEGRWQKFINDVHPNTKLKSARRMVREMFACKLGSLCEVEKCPAVRQGLCLGAKVFFYQMKQIDVLIRTHWRVPNNITKKMPRELSDIIFSQISRTAVKSLRERNCDVPASVRDVFTTKVES